MLRRVPGLHINWCADCTRRDRVHANPIRRDFLRDAFHHQHHTAFRRSVIHVTGPWDDFMNGADANDLAGAARDFRPDAARTALNIAATSSSLETSARNANAV